MDSELQEVIEGSLPMGVAEQYLNIYLGRPTQMTWPDHVGQVWMKLRNRPDPQERIRNMISHAILVPTTDKSIDVGDIPENFFHKSQFFRQLNERDWFPEFQDVVTQDIDINKYRAHARSLGVIDPIEYQPYTRQAFNWLYTRAEDSGVIHSPEDKERLTRQLQNLVKTYGGASICSVFTNHSDWLSKIHNWKSGYFFEKVLFRVYEPEQLYKIKKQELAKTDSKLVKRIRAE